MRTLAGRLLATASHHHALQHKQQHSLRTAAAARSRLASASCSSTTTPAAVVLCHGALLCHLQPSKPISCAALSTSSSGWQVTTDSSRDASFASSSTGGPSAGTTGSTSSSSSSSSGDPKLQVPPAVAAGAAAAGDAAAKAAKAVAKQASRLVKLVQSTSLSEATWLQLSSLWQSHSATITALTAAAATAGVHHLTTGVAGHFLDVADPSVYWSCLGASAAAVAVAGLQVRSSFTVDPDRVYRITMRKLNRHAGLQEVMGSPLAGSDVRLELVTQGTLFVQETLLPKRRAPRLHLMFQLTGPVKTGVVSVVAKKAFGSKYAFKTLMVELPDKTPTGQAALSAAAAALSKAQAEVTISTHSILASPSTQSSSSSGSSGESGMQEASSSPASSSSSAGAAAGGAGDAASGASSSAAAAAEPARIYLIGAPTSSSARDQSPAALLEDLKDPLLYALKRNLAGYEAEDESEGQLAWSKPQQDPDQTTWWDDGKTATKLLACRTLTAARAAGASAAAAAHAAAVKLRARAAAAAKASATPSSSSSQAGSPPSGSAAAAAVTQPDAAASATVITASPQPDSAAPTTSSSSGAAADMPAASSKT